MRIGKIVSRLQMLRKCVIPCQSDGRKLISTYSFLEIQEFTIVCYFETVSFYILEVVFFFGNHHFPFFAYILINLFLWKCRMDRRNILGFHQTSLLTAQSVTNKTEAGFPLFKISL